MSREHLLQIPSSPTSPDSSSWRRRVSANGDGEPFAKIIVRKLDRYADDTYVSDQKKKKQQKKKKKKRKKEEEEGGAAAAGEEDDEMAMEEEEGGEGQPPRILRGVSLDIPAGAVVGVIGPSGSGKSTFLRALNRLWEPPPDSVFLDGDDITSLNVVALRRRVGMLFQTPAMFDGTVADNIRYGPSLAGEKLDDARVEELLRIADLDPSFASKSVVGLSVGQAQRVALARTLANDPEVLLLDEPTSALDPISTHNIEEAVMSLSKRGLTVVMVSHSIKQVQRISTMVCVLVNGEVVEVLRPDELSSSTHPLVKQFLEAS